MKIIAIKIDQETNELLLRAENEDGSTTAIVWDICNFMEGRMSDLRMVPVQADNKVMEEEIISIPVPGFMTPEVSQEVYEAQVECLRVSENGNLH